MLELGRHDAEGQEVGQNTPEKINTFFCELSTVNLADFKTMTFFARL